MTFEILGKDEQALECYDKAVEVDPNNADAWINKGIVLYKVFYQMVLDYKNNVNPIPKLRQAFSDLEQWNIADAESVLLHTVRLKKDPVEYKVDSVRKRLGMVKNLNKNESVSYYLADKSKGNYTFNLKDLSIAEYKKMLVSVIDGLLKHMGHDIEHELFGKISLRDLL